MKMLMLKSDRLKAWLRVTKKNQLWLAKEYGVRPAYISQIMNNRTHISGNFIGFVLSITKMDFHDLFYFDAEKENRKFFGKDIHLDGKVFNSDSYYKIVRKKIYVDKDILEPVIS